MVSYMSVVLGCEGDVLTRAADFNWYRIRSIQLSLLPRWPKLSGIAWLDLV